MRNTRGGTEQPGEAPSREPVIQLTPFNPERTQPAQDSRSPRVSCDFSLQTADQRKGSIHAQLMELVGAHVRTQHTPFNRHKDSDTLTYIFTLVNPVCAGSPSQTVPRDLSWVILQVDNINHHPRGAWRPGQMPPASNFWELHSPSSLPNLQATHQTESPPPPPVMTALSSLERGP